MRFASNMQLLVNDITNSRDMITKSKKELLDYEVSLQKREEDRQKEAEQIVRKRRKGLKMFFGDVHTFLNEVQDDMKEARGLWNGLSLRKKRRK